jgi:hypothetical protein
MLQSFRSEVANLKKLGVLPKEIDARKVLPNAYLSRVRNEFFDVLAGTGNVKPVSKKAAKDLKRQGFTVRNNRVKVKRSETVRRGEVVPIGTESKDVAAKAKRRLRLYRTEDGELDEESLEDQAKRFFAGVKPDQYFGVGIDGNFKKVFHGGQMQEFIDWVVAAYGNRPDIKFLERVYVGGRDEAKKALQERADKRAKKYSEYDRRRKARWRENKKKIQAAIDSGAVDLDPAWRVKNVLGKVFSNKMRKQ